MNERIRMLFLAADPVDVLYRPRLGEEIREIDKRIRVAPSAESIELISKWAVTPDDLMESLLMYCPTIVHFTGHGTTNGIALEDEEGRMMIVESKQLQTIFTLFKNSVRLVVFNSCYSKKQMLGLSKMVDYVIGTNAALGDKAAIRFAASFYQALVYGHSVKAAFEFGKCQVSIGGISGSEVFTLLVREGINTSTPFLESELKDKKVLSVKANSKTAKANLQKTISKPNVKKAVSRLAGISSVPSNKRAQARGKSQLSDIGFRSAHPAFEEIFPIEIKESLEKFKSDYPDSRKAAFLMMRFGKTRTHRSIVAGIKKALDPLGISVLRADDRQYHDDLFPNVLTYVYGCGFGIAVFERIETEEFNPNVALEVGYMFALKKQICLLKDRTLKTLHADLVGKLYRIFDPVDPIGTIPKELSQWLKDKGLG
jgi:CHAT domain